MCASPQSRIDYVWYAGSAELTDSFLVGEEAGKDVDVSLPVWPSDHRAVVSQFEATAIPMPPLIATGKRDYTVEAAKKGG